MKDNSYSSDLYRKRRNFKDHIFFGPGAIIRRQLVVMRILPENTSETKKLSISG
jgi:hypothetical protein